MILVQELLQLGLIGAALEDLAAEMIKKVKILFGCLYLHAPSKISEVGSIDKVADKEEHSGGDEQVEEVEALEYSVEQKRRGAYEYDKTLSSLKIVFVFNHLITAF